MENEWNQRGGHYTNWQHLSEYPIPFPAVSFRLAIAASQADPLGKR